VSLTAGTILHTPKAPLTRWFGRPKQWLKDSEISQKSQRVHGPSSFLMRSSVVVLSSVRSRRSSATVSLYTLLARRRGRRALRLQADDRRAVVIVERPQHTVPEQVAHVHEGPSSLKATILAEIKEEIAEHGC